jgi:phosphatidate cytidylyltransferase
MLKQRVITAVVLLAVLLPALFAPVAWPFAMLTLVMIGAAGWEWARLNGVTAGAAVALGVMLAAACAVALAAGWAVDAPPLAWWIATLVWVLGASGRYLSLYLFFSFLILFFLFFFFFSFFF